MGGGWISLLFTFNIVVISMRLANIAGDVSRLTLLTPLSVKICGLKVSQHLNSPFTAKAQYGIRKKPSQACKRINANIEGVMVQYVSL